MPVSQLLFFINIPAILNHFKKILKKINILVFSDFNYVCLPQNLVNEMIKLAKKNKIITYKYKDLVFYVPSPGFDIIISNPPYIAESQKKLMEPNVLNFEPKKSPEGSVAKITILTSHTPYKKILFCLQYSRIFCLLINKVLFAE